MSAPKQMLLNLQVAWTPTLENYVAGSNRELISRLRGLADPRCFDAVYVWGSEGCGKSHLLGAVSTIAWSNENSDPSYEAQGRRQGEQGRLKAFAPADRSAGAGHQGGVAGGHAAGFHQHSRPP